MATVTEDFKDVNGNWVKYYPRNNTRYITKAGQVWGNMMTRCKVGGAAQKKDPTYRGCLVSANFSDFQYFANWYTSQVGYGLAQYHLDKDILVAGNKVYSEDSCVLIPYELNMFLGTRDKTKRSLPKGVHIHKAAQKFCSSISIDGNSTYLGLYATPTEASAVYKVAKDAEAYRWYERLKAGEFIVDERVIERMRTWKHICDWKPA